MTQAEIEARVIALEARQQVLIWLLVGLYSAVATGFMIGVTLVKTGALS